MVYYYFTDQATLPHPVENKVEIPLRLIITRGFHPEPRTLGTPCNQVRRHVILSDACLAANAMGSTTCHPERPILGRPMRWVRRPVILSDACLGPRRASRDGVSVAKDLLFASSCVGAWPRSQRRLAGWPVAHPSLSKTEKMGAPSMTQFHRDMGGKARTQTDSWPTQPPKSGCPILA